MTNTTAPTGILKEVRFKVPDSPVHWTEASWGPYKYRYKYDGEILWIGKSSWNRIRVKAAPGSEVVMVYNESPYTNKGTHFDYCLSLRSVNSCSCG